MMLTPATFASGYTKVCDLASKFLRGEDHRCVMNRAQASLTFFSSGVATNDPALRTVCIEAAYSELRAAVKELNSRGSDVRRTGWTMVTL